MVMKNPMSPDCCRDNNAMIVAEMLDHQAYDVVKKVAERVDGLADAIEAGATFQALKVEIQESVESKADKAELADPTGSSLIGFGLSTVESILSQTLSILAYGAKGDGVTDDTAAINLALTAAKLVKKPVFVPVGTYLVNDTLKVYSGIIGESTRLAIIKAKDANSFSTLNKPIVQIGWERSESTEQCHEVPVRGFYILGAGTRTDRRSGDQTTQLFNGVGLYFAEQTNVLMGTDISITNCYKGVVFNNRFGHLGLRDCSLANNWYNAYWQSNTGDYLFDSVNMGGALFASMGAEGDDLGDGVHLGGIFGLSTYRTHMGFSPYIYYQKDGTSTVGLVGCNFDHRHEQVGQQCYRVGVCTNGGTRVCSDNNFEKPGHSWTDPVADLGSYNSYTILDDPNHPIQQYALDFPLVRGQTNIYSGTSFLPGKTGYSTRIAILQGFWKDPESLYPYLVTGAGSDRLIYTGKPSHRVTTLHGNKQFGADGGGFSNFTPEFNIPKEFDNTMFGYISFNGRVKNIEPGPATELQVRVVVNGVRSGVITYIDIPAGSSQLIIPPIRFELGRRDRVADSHKVYLQIVSPTGAARDIFFGRTSNDQNIDTQITLTVEQNDATP